MKFRRSCAPFVLGGAAVLLGFGHVASGPPLDAVSALRRTFVVAAQETPERNFLSRVRRLTIDGRRAGEGYWSKDGRQLVFQSEREPGNPFYQIYLDRKSVV